MNIDKLTCCCISDTHGAHNYIDFSNYQDCDTLIFAGDWSRNNLNAKEEIKYFFNWLNSLDFKHKIIIAGNHETFVEREKLKFHEILKNYPDIIYLEDNSVVINNIKIYGSPYSNEFFNWAFMEYEFKLNDIWNKIEEDTNILITHGPAFLCLDKVNNNYSHTNHVGSESLSVRKKELKNLKVHISGHIHESYGFNNDFGILNICPCIMDVNYNPINTPIKFSIRRYKNNNKIVVKHLK